MTDDKKNSQGGSSLSHSGETTKKDALKGRYVNRTTELRKEKQKAKNRQQYAAHSEVSAAATHYVSDNTSSYSSNSRSTQSSRAYSDSDKAYGNNHSNSEKLYTTDRAADSSHSLSRSEIPDKRAASEKAAALKSKLESRLNAENITAANNKHDERSNITEQTIMSDKSPAKAAENAPPDDAGKNYFGKIGEYKSMSQDMKESYKKAMQVNQFTAKQQTADIYFSAISPLFSISPIAFPPHYSYNNTV